MFNLSDMQACSPSLCVWALALVSTDRRLHYMCVEIHINKLLYFNERYVFIQNERFNNGLSTSKSLSEGKGITGQTE